MSGAKARWTGINQYDSITVRQSVRISDINYVYYIIISSPQPITVAPIDAGLPDFGLRDETTVDS